MEASKEMESLLKRIYVPSVFYFPAELFPNISPEAKKAFEEYHFFEDLGILKVNEEVGLLKKSANTLEMLKKEDILEGNVFQLLEMKEHLKGQSFGFLLNKYLSNVKAWVNAYNWLFDNFDKQIPETDKNQKTLFEYQLLILNKHLEKLHLEFQFNINNVSTTNIEDILLKNNKVLPLDQSLCDGLIEDVKRVEVNKNHKSIKLQNKEPLLTDKQADDFLLKTVFNIKVD